MELKIANSWKNILKDEFEKSYFKDLTNFVKEEYDKHQCFPDKKDVFGEIWAEEARSYLVEMALERLKQAVKNPRDFQVFHCSKFLEWSTEKICESLDITANNMYLINKRVGEKFEEIILSLQKESE